MLEQYVRPFPRVVRIEPAGACNLRCSHCPTGTVTMRSGIMRWETFALVMQGLRANIGAVKVVVLYHGGEPLLNKLFGEMVKEVKTAGVPFVKTVSNGMLLTENTLVGFVDGGLDAIEFSLDGESPEENNFIRRDCDYAVVVRNIRQLIDYKRKQRSPTPKIFIASTQFVCKETYAPGQQPASPKYLAREFSADYAGEIAGFKCTFAMRWPHMEVPDDIYEVYVDPYDTEIRNYCDHVENTLTVRWNGDVVACCYDLTNRLVLGNVHQADLMTIWNSRSYMALRQSIAERKFIPLCANCNVMKPSAFLTLRPEARARLEAAGSESASTGVWRDDVSDEARRLERLWDGPFGNEYIERNSGTGEARGPFWRELLAEFRAESVLEVGSNVGGNLRWIVEVVPPGRVVGIDVNQVALVQLREALPGLASVRSRARELPFRESSFDLVFTVGVLIHQPEETLHAVMTEIVRCSRRYVFCAEYHAPETVEIVYRGQRGALFKRDYGHLYQTLFPGLRLRKRGFLGRDQGWDDVTFWMFEKAEACVS